MSHTQIFLTIHRILGTMLSILFLMWFLSGMVMMYHGYPSLPAADRLKHAESIVAGKYAAALRSSSTVSIEQVAGRTVGFDKDDNMCDLASGMPVTRLTDEALMQVAERWTASAPTLIDTLSEIDVWLIGAMPFREFPVYHYALNDGKGGELYVSSRTGRALQLTDSRSRFWAWVGAIPHWIYITKLRATGRQPWTSVVLWLSGAGIVMVLSGLVVGVRSAVVARRRRRLSPYAKPILRWHHLLGLAFGLFVLTWIFSGFMSLADAPQLIWPVRGEHSAKDVYAQEVGKQKFTLPAGSVLASADVKRLDMVEMGGVPYYHVTTADDDYLVDATQTAPHRSVLNASRCTDMVQQAYGKDVSVSAVLLRAYDDYYVSQKQQLPLPVYKVTTDNADGDTYYINPKNGACRYYNNNRRAGKWMYTGMHALNTAFFADRPVLRSVVMWLLLLGGTAVSLTGLVLSVRYLRRRLR